MSKISNDGLQQIQIIKNALDSMYDKLNQTVYVPRKKTSKNIDGDYHRINLFQNVNDEFSAISEIIASTNEWKKVR